MNALASNYVAPPTEGTAAKRQGWFRAAAGAGGWENKRMRRKPQTFVRRRATLPALRATSPRGEAVAGGEYKKCGASRILF